MLPLGHAALAYLLYVGYAAVRNHRLPVRYGFVPLAIGSQFPDLIDKPLAYIGVLASGRSLAHSLFTFLLITGLVWWIATRFTNPDEEPWRQQLRSISPSAFGIGYGSHLIGDSYGRLIAGEFPRFLLYPLYRIPESPLDDVAPWIRMLRIYQEMHTHPQLELLLLALLVFVGIRIHAYRKEPPLKPAKE